MKEKNIFNSTTRLILPFIYMYSFSLIIYGHDYPGGGFQGGTFLATAFFLQNLQTESLTNSFKKIVFMEKILVLLFVILVLFSLFLNSYTVYFYVLLNVVIGMEVSFGLYTIIILYLEEVH